MSDPVANRNQIGQLPASGSPREEIDFFLRMIKGILPIHYVHVFRADDLAIPNSAWTDVFWQTAGDDDSALWTPASAVCTIPETGLYAVSCQVAWPVAATTGMRGLRLLKATDVFAEVESVPVTFRHLMQCQRVLRIEQNSQIKAQCYQNSGGSIDLVGGGLNDYHLSLTITQLWRP